MKRMARFVVVVKWAEAAADGALSPCASWDYFDTLIVDESFDSGEMRVNLSGCCLTVLEVDCC
jgi:hypothetical protein